MTKDKLTTDQLIGCMALMSEEAHQAGDLAIAEVTRQVVAALARLERLEREQ